MPHANIVTMLGQLIFDATAHGWQIRSVVRSMQSDARYVTLRFGKYSTVVRVAKHRKRSGNWDQQLLTSADVRLFCNRVLKAKAAPVTGKHGIKPVESVVRDNP